ncbi:methyltransferase domain-containing protein [Synechococcus sp. MIT S9452]|uniref:methyltransferase domain-containing protein n=1 Tax=Synechococcus sp. MIT S9452 TaxID=3082546 RepID=UPI0039A56BF3
MKKFSKSLGDIAAIKQSFAADNDHMFSNAIKINSSYASQPLRGICKTCGAPLSSDSPDFTSHGIDYVICAKCGHLNGIYDDTENFCNHLYVDEGGSNYSRNYLNDYSARVKNIYLPKVDFLCSSLMEQKQTSCENISISDFGCGGGHFVHAANQRGIKAQGFDVSEGLIELASEAFQDVYGSNCPCPFTIVHNEVQLLEKMTSCDTTVASFIGVLEHLRRPLDFFEAFKSSQCKYLFFSVPLFSLSCLIENVFPNIFPRQLSGGHTHLYSHSSIKYILEKYEFRQISSWHFGADAMDLRRSMLVSMIKSGCSERLLNTFQNDLFSAQMLDEIQCVIDTNLAASEIHMLIEKDH